MIKNKFLLLKSKIILYIQFCFFFTEIKNKSVRSLKDTRSMIYFFFLNFFLKNTLILFLKFEKKIDNVAIAPKIACIIIPPVPGSIYAWALKQVNEYIKVRKIIFILFTML